MRTGTLAALAVALIGVSHTSSADDGTNHTQPKILVVLPLDVRHTNGKLGKDSEAALEEVLRDMASDTLPSSRWTILTGETTLQIMRDNGRDPAKCTDEECALASARVIGADIFISGVVEYVDGEYLASVRLIGAKDGRILAADEAEGRNVLRLRKAFKAKATGFFERAGLIAAGAGSVPAVASRGPSIRPASAASDETPDVAPATDECPPGQSKTEDTAGHCCWAGQVWGGGKCIGKPDSCPSGLQATMTGCELPACDAGQQRLDGEHCCWPGQVWSRMRNVCKGPPTQCPDGYVTMGETCHSMTQAKTKSPLPARGWIGVGIEELTPALAEVFGLKENHGALIAQVFPNGPAATAGLRNGDVVTEFGGHSIDSPAELASAVSAAVPGTPVELTFLRDGQDYGVEVRVAKRLGTSVEGLQQENADPVVDIGLMLATFAPNDAGRFAAQRGESLVVLSVRSGSAAMIAGVEAGDLLIALQNTAVSSIEQCGRIAKGIKPGDSVLFRIRRGGVALYMAAQMPNE